MKDKLENKDSEEQKREQWMLQLPPEMSKNFGLGPRQFSKASGGPKRRGDRSGWTETPEDREKRARGEKVEETKEDDDEDVKEYLANLQRDQQMEKASESLKQKRGSESLVQLHSKKLKKKHKKEKDKGGKQERRAFDRDIDLQANRFDAAQKELMLKKAAKLDGRFSRGSQQFL